jgi:uncharacterized heparinase superfamily protein
MCRKATFPVPRLLLTPLPIQLTASMWSPEQAKEIHATARDIMGAKLKIMALPQGLQVERGPDAVVEYLVEQLPAMIEEGDAPA